VLFLLVALLSRRRDRIETHFLQLHQDLS